MEKSEKREESKTRLVRLDDTGVNVSQRMTEVRKRL